jgi:cell division protein FtsQ
VREARGEDVVASAARAAATVVTAMPDATRERVRSVEIRTLDDIRITLGGSREVRWGSAERSTEKAAVLEALLRRDASVYDVSAPDLPTTRRNA